MRSTLPPISFASVEDFDHGVHFALAPIAPDPVAPLEGFMGVLMPTVRSTDWAPVLLSPALKPPVLAFSVAVSSEMDTSFGLFSATDMPTAPVRSVTRRPYFMPPSVTPLSTRVRRLALMLSGLNSLSIRLRASVPGTLSAESPLAARLSAAMASARTASVLATASTCSHGSTAGFGEVSIVLMVVFGATATVAAPGANTVGSDFIAELSDTQRLTLPLISGNRTAAAGAGCAVVPVFATVAGSGTLRNGEPGVTRLTHDRFWVNVVTSMSNATSCWNSWEFGLPTFSAVLLTVGPAAFLVEVELLYFAPAVGAGLALVFPVVDGMTTLPSTPALQPFCVVVELSSLGPVDAAPRTLRASAWPRWTGLVTLAFTVMLTYSLVARPCFFSWICTPGPSRLSIWDFSAVGDSSVVSLRWLAIWSARSEAFLPMSRGLLFGSAKLGRKLPKPGRPRSAVSTWPCTWLAGANSPTLTLPAAAAAARYGGAKRGVGVGVARFGEVPAGTCRPALLASGMPRRM